MEEKNLKVTSAAGGRRNNRVSDLENREGSEKEKIREKREWSSGKYDKKKRTKLEPNQLKKSVFERIFGTPDLLFLKYDLKVSYGHKFS